MISSISPRPQPPFFNYISGTLETTHKYVLEHPLTSSLLLFQRFLTVFRVFLMTFFCISDVNLLDRSTG